MVLKAELVFLALKHYNFAFVLLTHSLSIVSNVSLCKSRLPLLSFKFSPFLFFLFLIKVFIFMFFLSLLLFWVHFILSFLSPRFVCVCRIPHSHFSIHTKHQTKEKKEKEKKRKKRVFKHRKERKFVECSPMPEMLISPAWLRVRKCSS